MAAGAGRITLVPNAVTQVTLSDCTNIRYAIQTDGLVRFMATPNATAPAESAFQSGVYLYEKGETVPADLSLAAMFPNVTTPVRLWAFADYHAVVTFAHD